MTDKENLDKSQLWLFQSWRSLNLERHFICSHKHTSINIWKNRVQIITINTYFWKTEECITNQKPIILFYYLPLPQLKWTSWTIFSLDTTNSSQIIFCLQIVETESFQVSNGNNIPWAKLVLFSAFCFLTVHSFKNLVGSYQFDSSQLYLYMSVFISTFPCTT